MIQATWFLAGLVIGTFYFASLRWNAGLYTRGIATAAGVQIARFAALGVILVFIARQGPLPLLLTALGVVLARPLVTRLLR